MAKEDTDKFKQSLYLKGATLNLVRTEMIRLDRSMSWVVSRCIKEGIEKVKQLPGMSF